MCAAIHIGRFEQFFSEKVLRRGLALFAGDKISEINALPQGEYYFVFTSLPVAEVRLKVNGDTLVHSVCTCGKIYCAHLCACLFYLAGEKLNLSNQSATPRLQLKFQTATAFNKLRKAFAKLVKRELRTGNHKHSSESMAGVEKLIREFSLLHSDSSELLLHLVFLTEFCDLFVYRKSINETVSENPLIKSCNALSRLVRRGLSAEEKRAWLASTELCLSNNKKFNSGLYIYLIVYLDLIGADADQLESIKNVLARRKINRYYQQQLNMKTIAQYMLGEQQMKLSGSKAMLLPELVSPEQSIAIAELYFRDGQTVKGLKVLRKDYEKIKEASPINFVDYLQYLIKTSNTKGHVELELFFIKEIIIHDYFIPAIYLERLRDLLSEQDRKTFIDELIEIVKRQIPEISLDKLFQILESEERWDEMLRELNRYDNKFRFVNRVALGKLPEYSDFLFKIYLKHFVNGLYEARELHHQKQIFEMARNYFDRLPPMVAKKLVASALEKISKNNFIYGHLIKYSEEFM
jgi:hypothetical protein